MTARDDSRNLHEVTNHKTANFKKKMKERVYFGKTHRNHMHMNLARFEQGTHPNVDLRPRVLLSLEDLWRGVRRGPAPRGQLLARRVVVAEPEVCDLDVHVSVHQQVLSLQPNPPSSHQHPS